MYGRKVVYRREKIFKKEAHIIVKPIHIVLLYAQNLK